MGPMMLNRMERSLENPLREAKLGFHFTADIAHPGGIRHAIPDGPQARPLCKGIGSFLEQIGRGIPIDSDTIDCTGFKSGLI